MQSSIDRRHFIKILGISSAAILVSPQNIFLDNHKSNYTLYVGTYTAGKSKGIYILEFNVNTGGLIQKNFCAGIENPSFLVVNSNNKFLYAVSEIGNYKNQKSGGIYSYKIDQENNSLQFINSVSSNGAHPCHLTVDRNDKYVIAANYSDGNISVIKINDDGSLGERTDFVQHYGKSVNKSRQEAPHTHSVNIDASNKIVVAADLGIDKLMLYKFDDVNGKLNPTEQIYLETKPGAGPRHFTFHLNRKFAFVINELDCTITSLHFNPRDYLLEPIETVSTLPDDFKGENTCADIHIHPNGKFVYGSNRGHDSIAVFSFDETNGKLSLIQHQSTLGKTPRNFTIDPSGKFLLAANQNSDSIIVFSIDQLTGKLYETNQKIEIPSPVCLLFNY